MIIQEAIKARTADKPFIVRRIWMEEYGCLSDLGVKILPTDTPDYCIIQSKLSKVPSRGWQPSARDLVADDWEPSG